MKTSNIIQLLRDNYKRMFAGVSGMLIVLTILSSCKMDGIVIPEVANVPLALSTPDSNVVLNQKLAKNAAVTLTWTTGTNHGTGASISYVLQIDKKGNKFSKALNLNIGKAVYSKIYTTAELNDSLLNRWKFAANTKSQLEARVVAIISADNVKPDTSRVITLNVTPYLPVTKTLYLVGDATPNGWDIANATQMIADANDPTIFRFQGVLKVGDFKFPVNRNTNWAQDMYMRTSDTQMYLHLGGAADESKWHISESALYKIEVNLLDLTINIIKLGGPAYSNIYMVGDATPNGWDIANATPMVQNSNNLYQFTWDGILTPGDFKFPVNQNTNWGQDMFMRDPASADSSKIYLHHGGASDDNKWHITKGGWYHITLDLANNTISCKPLSLYIVGSATSIGWTITSAIQLVQDPNLPYIFTYTGALVAGEFKFPVNRQSDWGQDMYMMLDNTHMYFHKGGASDDSKWTITQAGNYVLTLNVKALTIQIQKQ